MILYIEYLNCHIITLSGYDSCLISPVDGSRHRRWPRPSARSAPGHAMSIPSPPSSCLACPVISHALCCSDSIKKTILLYTATTILFSHDTMTPFEVYAFADILSSNIILPLRWTDIIIVAIFCPPYMYCIIYNLEYI